MEEKNDLHPELEGSRHIQQLMETEQGRGMLSGPKNSFKNVRTHIQHCPRHFQTRAHTDSISSPYLFLTWVFLSPFPTDIDDQLKGHKNNGNKTGLRGSRSLVLGLVWGKCLVCGPWVRAYVSVHTYAVCSVPAVCLPHQCSRCCWGSGGVTGPAWLHGSILSCGCWCTASPAGRIRPALSLLSPCRWWSLTQRWRKVRIVTANSVALYGPRCLKSVISKWGWESRGQLSDK